MQQLQRFDMTEILAPFRKGRSLLAFDFDGTLAPIVNERSNALMRRETVELLRYVCEAYTCAVISGRSRADVAARVAPAAIQYIVGNHGMEPASEVASKRGAMQRVLSWLRPRVADIEGAEIEDKDHSLSLHFRNASEPTRVESQLVALLTNAPSRIRVIPGIFVLNVVPEHAPNKGDALMQLMALERAQQTLYVGDDTTDEDVFRLGSTMGLLTVRIGRASTSAARYFLNTQVEIDALLQALLELTGTDP